MSISKQLSLICNKYFTQRLLIGSDIDSLKQEDFNIPIIKCDLLGNTVVMLGGEHPLNNKSVTINAIVELDNYMTKIESSSMVYTNNEDENLITIHSTFGANETIDYRKIIDGNCEII